MTFSGPSRRVGGCSWVDSATTPQTPVWKPTSIHSEYFKLCLIVKKFIFNLSPRWSLSSSLFCSDHLPHQVANWRVPGEARPRRKVSRFCIHRLSNGDHHIILHCMDPCNKDNGPAICNSLQVTILESCFNSQPHWIDGKEVDIEKLLYVGQRFRRE